MPRLTGVKQGIHLLHGRWPVAPEVRAVIHLAKLKFNFAQSGYGKAILEGLKVAIVSGDDFAADDYVQLDAALAAQGHDVTACVMHCRTTESTSAAERYPAFLSQAYRPVTVQKLSPSSAWLAGVP
jgi:hypothetical protein